MKKVIAAIMVLLPLVLVAGCGKSTSVKSQGTISSASLVSSAQSKIPNTQTKRDLESGNYKDMGNGAIVISTPSGTSENKETPVLFVGSGDVMIQIGIDVKNFDASKLSYVYIDGILNCKEQYGDAQSSLNLSQDALSVGNHKVEVVQYDTNISDGKIITYKSASYEVKPK